MAPGAGSRAGRLLAAPSPAELVPTGLLKIKFTSTSLQRDWHQQSPITASSCCPHGRAHGATAAQNELKSGSQTAIPAQIKDNSASTLQPLHFLTIKPAPTWLLPTELSSKTQLRFQQQHHSKKSSVPVKISPETSKTWGLGEALVMGTAGGISGLSAITPGVPHPFPHQQRLGC